MKTQQLFLIILFSLLSSLMLNAAIPDHMHFSHIGLDDGLSHSTVVDIRQDNDGNLWFATHDGVNKYDGYNFTVYRHQYSEPGSIASDMSRCLCVDGKGRIWVGTREGVSLYQPQTDSFVNYYYQKNGQNVTINGIVPVDDTTLMLGTADGLVLFDIDNGRFYNDPLPVGLHKMSVSALSQGDQCVYVGGNGLVYRYVMDRGVLEKLIELSSDISIQAVFSQSGDRIWVATEGNGLYRYDVKSKELRAYHDSDLRSGLNSDYVRSIALDSDNNLWVGTYDGLNIYNEDTDNFVSIRNSEIEEGSLSQNSVRCIFQDSQGGMWLGTYWGGLNYYHPLCNRFQNMHHVPLVNSLSDNVVNCIVEDNGHNLWIGTSGGGLNYYDNNKKTFKSYAFASDAHGVPFKDIKTVYVDENRDRVYVGAHAGGMMVVHRKSGNVEYYNRHNSNLPSNHIYSIVSDGNGGLWIAALEYLLHFDLDKRSFKIVSAADVSGKIQRNFRVLFRDSANRLWVGAEKGMAIYDQHGDSVSENTDFIIPQGLSQAFINCFYESTSGQMWIGTRNGLFALKPGESELIQYTTSNGLPSNVVYGILEDNFGRLWISTNQGLSCITLDNDKFRTFTVVDGLQSNQFNAGAYCRRHNGYMLFGGINGITYFWPEMLVDNPYTPKPVINKVLIYNKEVLPGSEADVMREHIDGDHVTLSADENSFAVSFVVSNYIAGKHNTFSYKLDGYDEAWYRQNDILPVSYSNLPAGNYTFRVKAANNDGIWNDEAAVLHIRILPVWYRTWWAITLFVVLIALAIYGVVRFFWLRKSMEAQIQMERLDKEKQEEVNQMKIRFYVNISHELRTPLTLIIAPLQELLSRAKGYWEQEQLMYIQRNTNRLLHLVNQLMDFRRAELGIFKLRAGFGNATRQVQSCFVNYEHLAKRKDIDYNFYTDIHDEDVLFDGNYLELISNNLLSNAFKYTDKGGSITVNLFKKDGFLVLRVSDTGVGIAPDKQAKIFERFYQVENFAEGSGIGLSLVQRLVEMHHGRIELESEEGKGSIFTVYIPQDESVYSSDELVDESDDNADERVYSTNARDAYVDDDIEFLSDDDEDPDDNDEDVDNDENSGRQGTILIVEDNDELRQYMVNGLSSVFNVHEAENGQRALDVLKDHEVDVIITDVMMPEIDGVKLCKLVKQNLRTCHIPVYMLSAKQDLKYQLEGLQVGADDYIAKPFSIEVLKIKIKNMLRTRNRTFERYSDMTEMEVDKLATNTLDEELLKRAIEVVEKNMDNVEFSTEQFARELGMSRSNLHLKLKAITGKSAIDFINKIRFSRACQLLREGKYTVSEISFMVGYNTPSYFAARFKKYVGCLPTEYKKK